MCRATQLCLQRHSPGRAPAREGFLLFGRGVISELFGGLCPQERKNRQASETWVPSATAGIQSRARFRRLLRPQSLVDLAWQAGSDICAWHLHLNPLVHQCPGVSCPTLPPGEESADPKELFQSRSWVARICWPESARDSTAKPCFVLSLFLFGVVCSSLVLSYCSMKPKPDKKLKPRTLSLNPEP